MDQPGLFTDAQPDVPPPWGAWTAHQLAWLLEQPGIGQGRVRTIIDTWRSPAEYKADSGKARLGSWSELLPTEIRETSTPAGLSMVGVFDHAYPAPLRDIPDAPPVLWYVGTLPSEWRAVAVVGTRSPDEFGASVASSAARSVVEAGGIVISGLALGCDTIAHRETLAAGGVTVAVLATDPRQPAPASNRELAHRIVEGGGALLAETPPSTRANAGLLVSRDRIQSGLSKATIVAQTGIPGGTLHTAGFTLEQGRTLIVAKPHGKWAESPLSAGNLALCDSTDSRSNILPSRFQKRFNGKVPLADRIAEHSDDLPQVLAEVFG